MERSRASRACCMPRPLAPRAATALAVALLCASGCRTRRTAPGAPLPAAPAVVRPSAREPRCATARCETLCQSGQRAACTRTVELYLEGKEGLPVDHQRSLRHARQACAAGDALGCSLLGLHHQDGLGTSWDPQEALAAYEKACGGRAGVGCYNLATMYSGGHGVDVDPERTAAHLKLARAYWEAACAGDERRWCTNLAFLVRQEGGGSRAASERARDLNQRACDHGVAVGCLGAATARWQLGELTAAAWVAALERLCAAGEEGACATVGGGLIAGSGGVAPDPARGLRLVRRACELGDKHGCLMLAEELVRGELLPADLDAATRYLTMACDRALSSACLQLGRAAYARRRLAAASSFTRRACQMGSGEACAALSSLCFAGEGVPQSERDGVRWAREACRMGVAAGCGVLLQRDLDLPVPGHVMQRLYAESCKSGVATSCRRLERERRRSP